MNDAENADDDATDAVDVREDAGARDELSERAVQRSLAHREGVEVGDECSETWTWPGVMDIGHARGDGSDATSESAPVAVPAMGDRGAVHDGRKFWMAFASTGNLGPGRRRSRTDAAHNPSSLARSQRGLHSQCSQ